MLIFRRLIYIFSMIMLACLPDIWLWHIGIGEWAWPLRALWLLPSAVLIVAELGLQMGVKHKLAVRVLFTMVLLAVMPKIVFIVFDMMLPWYIALLPALAVMGWFVYGFARGWKRLVVKQETFRFYDFPAYLDGYKIVQLSDFHLGSYSADTDFVKRVVDAVNEQCADMMVFTGDLVNNSADEVEPFFNDLKRLHAPDGIFSIWGNHDYCEYGDSHRLRYILKNQRKLAEYQRNLGWTQLMNAHQTVGHGMAEFDIIGVENSGIPPFNNRGNLDKAMKGIAPGAFKILLTHDPHHWKREVLEKGIQLTLSGHTHAGQLKIGSITPARLAFREWGGVYRKDNEVLNVSAGIGGSFPFRLGAWPEITVITLKVKHHG